LVFAFARKRQFRVELYLRSGDQNDKRVFDALYAQKEAIEKQVGKALNWQRLDAKQASWIALYHPGRTIDSPKKLAVLREWAMDAIVRLAHAVVSKAEAALDAICGMIPLEWRSPSHIRQTRIIANVGEFLAQVGGLGEIMPFAHEVIGGRCQQLAAIHCLAPLGTPDLGDCFHLR
jgi:hypothetical protein